MGKFQKKLAAKAAKEAEAAAIDAAALRERMFRKLCVVSYWFRALYEMTTGCALTDSTFLHDDSVSQSTMRLLNPYLEAMSRVHRVYTNFNAAHEVRWSTGVDWRILHTFSKQGFRFAKEDQREGLRDFAHHLLVGTFAYDLNRCVCERPALSRDRTIARTRAIKVELVARVHASVLRTIARTRVIKDELIARAFSPNRIKHFVLTLKDVQLGWNAFLASLGMYD